MPRRNQVVPFGQPEVTNANAWGSPTGADNASRNKPLISVS